MKLALLLLSLLGCQELLLHLTCPVSLHVLFGTPIRWTLVRSTPLEYLARCFLQSKGPAPSLLLDAGWLLAQIDPLMNCPLLLDVPPDD